jgi:hypothetical protein
LKLVTWTSFAVRSSGIAVLTARAASRLAFQDTIGRSPMVLKVPA